MHRVDAVRNSPGVRREIAEGIGSLSGWRKGVRQKKIETRRKIIGGSPKACRERFVEGIGKLAGNTPGDYRKKTGRLAARMPEATGLTGPIFGWLTVANPLRLESLYAFLLRFHSEGNKERGWPTVARPFTRAADQRPAHEGQPTAASPTTSRGGGVGRKGGCPLVRRLPAARCHRRQRRGDDNGAVKAKRARASF
ncbi:hypothetical protein B296_00058696 [Ensete ventricosum]|uniref:Uncharacterized protein n=1 Tax=Ensete ventricosum TaxID=4639 RepID=A0A426WWL1_ENSVE|nr:hypothetical protein B296_00058696 [Ensete ventricosum]